MNIEEEVSDDRAAQVIGGLVATTLAVGEEGGDIFCPVKPPITSDIRRENGGF